MHASAQETQAVVPPDVGTAPASAASQTFTAPVPIAVPTPSAAPAKPPAESAMIVNAMLLTYDQPIPNGPPTDELLKLEVTLGKGTDGYYSLLVPKPDGRLTARPGVASVRLKLADIPSLPDHRFHASAISSISQQVTEQLDHRGLMGVYVISDPKDLAPGPEVPAPAALHLVIHNGAAEHDGPAYRLSEFALQYSREIADVPALGVLAQRPVTFGQITQGDQTYYVSPETLNVRGESVPRADLTATVHSKISAAPALPGRLFRNSALLTVEEELVKAINEQGIGGVYVEADKKDLDAAAIAAKNTEVPAAPVHLTIHVATATMVRTIETGPHTHPGSKTDNPADARIKTHSPIQAQGTRKLLKTNALDEYVLRLNRQPGRHVDVAVAAGDELDSVSLDYLVTETNPWVAFFQLSNTGTRQTDAWRERLGFTSHQLTGHDDNLTLDYTTAGFDQSHALMGSYDFPLFGSDIFRGRVFSSYSAFTASDVGEGAQTFNGDSVEAGAELIANIFQRRALFVDAFGGAKYQHIRVDNSTTGDKGSGDYALPYIGLRLDDTTETASVLASVTLLGDFTGTSRTSQDHLGRLDAATNFPFVQGDLSSSFFLEPLIDPLAYKRGQSSLAHEIALSVRGQYAFDRRFIAEQEQVAGGLYSVRGYPESIVSGDSVVVATGEYRFHLPRVFPVQRDPARVFGQPFRFAPQQPYGRPDWDLIFRGFVDVGQTVNSKIEPFEKDATLVGTGVGLELVLKHNISLRADWGLALTGVDAKAAGGTSVEAGSNRFHLVFTFSY